MRKRSVRPLVLVIAVLLSSPVWAQNGPGKGSAPGGGLRDYTDALGRAVELPRDLRRVAPSGFMAQMFLYALAPDRLVGLASKPSESMKRYLLRSVADLPIFGQFYGIASNLNLEALIAADPEVIIDVGEPKKNMRQDLDSIQHRTGIPVVFIAAADFESYGAAFRTLGGLLGEPAAAEALARFSEEAVARAAAESAAAKQESPPVRVYYGEGKSGLQTVAAGTLHSQTIDRTGAVNVAVLPENAGAGGTQVSMEQLLLWDPDLIVLGYGATAAVVDQDPVWRELRAVRAGRVYSIPSEPYGWLGRPPAVNRLIGLYWLGALCRPDRYPGDELASRVRTFHRLFYHYDLNDAELDAFLRTGR